MVPSRCLGGRVETDPTKVVRRKAMPHLQESVQTCIDACASCHRVCVETLAHCLRMGGPHAAANHVTRMLDCAQICQVSADMMGRESELSHATCALCADACDRCAESCEAMDDAEMRACAEACRRCAASCRQMAA